MKVAARHESFSRSHFEHGTRASYVRGCRCQQCRTASTRYSLDREEERRQRARELAPANPAPAQLVPREWTAPDGSRRVRHYKRACPGVNGSPCEKGSFLRKDSTGGICGRCRVLLDWRGLVDATPARRHLRKLSRRGVGRRSVAACSDAAATSIELVKTGRAKKVRAQTAQRILSIDEGARADASSVDAAATWRAVDELQRLGWTKGAIARALGRTMPALQLGRERVLLRNEYAVLQLLKRERAAARCARCGGDHRDDPTARQWCLENRDAPVGQLERLK